MGHDLNVYSQAVEQGPEVPDCCGSAKDVKAGKNGVETVGEDGQHASSCGCCAESNGHGDLADTDLNEWVGEQSLSSCYRQVLTVG